jgi:hypothetical protein
MSTVVASLLMMTVVAPLSLNSYSFIVEVKMELSVIVNTATPFASATALKVALVNPETVTLLPVLARAVSWSDRLFKTFSKSVDVAAFTAGLVFRLEFTPPLKLLYGSE